MTIVQEMIINRKILISDNEEIPVTNQFLNVSSQSQKPRPFTNGVREESKLSYELFNYYYRNTEISFSPETSSLFVNHWVCKTL